MKKEKIVYYSKGRMIDLSSNYARALEKEKRVSCSFMHQQIQIMSMFLNCNKKELMTGIEPEKC